MHKELTRRKHLTLQLVWHEHREQHPDGYSYSQYCELYRQWKSRKDLVMLQEPKAGREGLRGWSGRSFVDSQGRFEQGRPDVGGAERSRCGLRAAYVGMTCFLREIQDAPQLTALERWCRILSRALQKYFQGRVPKPPPGLLPA